MASSERYLTHVTKASEDNVLKEERLEPAVKGKAGELVSSDEVESEDKRDAEWRPLPRLPIEVWENAINHLWYDKRTLRNCIRTCRAWYPPSHFHLVGFIQVSTVTAVMACAKKLKQTPELSKRPHNMHIGGDFPYHFPTHIDFSVLSLAAIVLAPKLLRLKRLTIRRAEWQPWRMHKDVCLHLSAFSVTRLVLDDVAFPSVNVFGHLVCALPHLADLQCSDLKFTHYHFHRDTFDLYRNRVKIRSLELDHPPLESEKLIVDFLAHPCISSHLQTCIINTKRSDHLQQYNVGVQRLLNAASESLLLLQFQIERVCSERQTDTEVSAADSVLSLTHNISLQELWLYVDSIPQDSDLDSLRQALLSVKSGQLREIVIVFRSYLSKYVIMEGVKNAFKNHESAHCEEIDDYLSSNPFRTLSKVECRLSPRFPHFKHEEIFTAVEEQWKQNLAPLFPRLTERGIFCATVMEWGYDDIHRS